MLKQFFLIIISISYFSFCKNERNNVCQTLSGYMDMDNDLNCWYDPDVCSSPEAIIRRRGYHFESYRVEAEDGYQNVLYRVLQSKTNITGWPILMLGGIGGGPQTFLKIGNRSLVFFLANNGFDVWLSNKRGAFERKQNKTFWEFSFHDIGYYDVIAQVDFIRNITSFRKKVILLGFSMGTTESYVYAILRRRHARRNISGIISVAPLAFLTHTKGWLPKLAPFAKLIEIFLRLNKIYALDVQIDPKKHRLSFGKIVLLRSILFQVAGHDSGQIRTADLPSNFCKSSPIAVHTLVHYAQELNADGNFQYYDYGNFGNKVVYESPTPPDYNLSKIRVPVHFFYGQADFLSTPEDVIELYKALTVKNKSLTPISTDGTIKFNHFDFTLAKNITTLFHEVLLKTIKQKLRA